MGYHRVEIVTIDEYKGTEVVTVDSISYSTDYIEVMTVDEYEGTEVVTIGIRAVDPRMRGDGFNAEEFLRRSQIEEFLLKQKETQKENVEVATDFDGLAVKEEEYTYEEEIQGNFVIPFSEIQTHIVENVEMENFNVFNEFPKPNIEVVGLNFDGPMVPTMRKFNKVASEIGEQQVFDEMSKRKKMGSVTEIGVDKGVSASLILKNSTNKHYDKLQGLVEILNGDGGGNKKNKYEPSMPLDSMNWKRRKRKKYDSNSYSHICLCLKDQKNNEDPKKKELKSLAPDCVRSICSTVQVSSHLRQNLCGARGNMSATLLLNSNLVLSFYGDDSSKILASNLGHLGGLHSECSWLEAGLLNSLSYEQISTRTKLLQIFSLLDKLWVRICNLLCGKLCAKIQSQTRTLVMVVVDGACEVFCELQKASNPPPYCNIQS